ncbi:MAG: PhzF family phenazine biosynthesis protein [Planctomycetota bacterium]|jgi:trans-2,3-dihydro-3-hydroxyanthranilate isomerase
MKKMEFYILDVFAEEKYAGNQLAVVRDAASLSDDAMQRIAKEMNYSETTFILSDAPRDGGYNVRIFTPKEEVPFAGHPTLGTAFIIQNEIMSGPVEKVVLNLTVGQIPVTFGRGGDDKGVLWMRQNEPVFGQVIEPAWIASVLSLDESEIDVRFGVEEVSTGLPVIIVPLNGLDAAKRASIRKDEYFELIEETQAKAILVYCPETYAPENDLNVRVFCDYYGIPEDPATGSANCCLAGYLVKHRYFGGDRIDIRVEQGHEIARPSLLYLRAGHNQGQIDVSVGGKVVMVAKGQLL